MLAVIFVFSMNPGGKKKGIDIYINHKKNHKNLNIKNETKIVKKIYIKKVIYIYINISIFILKIL